MKILKCIMCIFLILLVITSFVKSRTGIFKMEKFVVDRIEDEIIVIEDEGGNISEVSNKQFNKEIREGDIVTLNSSGKYDLNRPSTIVMNFKMRTRMGKMFLN